MNYAKNWEMIRKRLHAAISKLNADKKLLAFADKSSEVDKAAKDLDSAIKKNKADAIAAASRRLADSAPAYVAQANALAGPDAKIKKEIRHLEKTLDSLVKMAAGEGTGAGGGSVDAAAVKKLAAGMQLLATRIASEQKILGRAYGESMDKISAFRAGEEKQKEVEKFIDTRMKLRDSIISQTAASVGRINTMVAKIPRNLMSPELSVCVTDLKKHHGLLVEAGKAMEGIIPTFKQVAGHKLSEVDLLVRESNAFGDKLSARKARFYSIQTALIENLRIARAMLTRDARLSDEMRLNKKEVEENLAAGLKFLRQLEKEMHEFGQHKFIKENGYFCRLLKAKSRDKDADNLKYSLAGYGNLREYHDSIAPLMAEVIGKKQELLAMAAD
jgi:hypothetical protein